jgi:hypothetical protein
MILNWYKMIAHYGCLLYRKEATAFKYLSDGSGRDSYILINSGGLHAPNTYGTKQAFANSLRYIT